MATIPGVGHAVNIAYDSGKGDLYVTNSFDDTVSVISDSSNSVIGNITVPYDPQGVAYDGARGDIRHGLHRQYD